MESILRGGTSAARILAEYLVSHFQDPSCWLGGAEAVFQMSKYHLIRSFKSRYKVTPHQFLTNLRMNYAAERLRDRRDKVIDIAYESGFDDLSTFNKCFKRFHQLSPREFGKRWTLSSARGENE